MTLKTFIIKAIYRVIYKVVC